MDDACLVEHGVEGLWGQGGGAGAVAGGDGVLGVGFDADDGFAE